MESSKAKIIESLVRSLQGKPAFYKRPILEKIQPEKLNFPVDFTSSKGSFKFFPYNSETIRDYGWGCAWRAIQSIINTQFSLENLDITLNFEDLFNYFGQKETLLALFQSAFPNDVGSIKWEALLKTDFAPHDLESGWAEPFIGQLCLNYFKIPCELFLLNGLPEYHNTPKEIFDTTLVFSDFVEKLLSKMKLPVMIDDGTFAMTILDVIKVEDTYKFTMGDPHIKEKVPKDSCLYFVIIDNEGNQIKNSVGEEQAPFMYFKDSYDGVHFREKKWMVLFPI